MDPSDENLASQPEPTDEPIASESMDSESTDEPTAENSQEGEEVRRVTYGLLTSPSRSGGKRVRNGVFKRIKEFIYAMLAERP